MAALLQANPEAFIRGNMHLLKQGAVLRSPRQDELAQIDAAQARAIVQQQTAQWRQARAPIPQPAAVAATAAEKTATTAAPAVAGARLEIAPAVAAAASHAGTTSGLDAGGEGDMLANQQLRQAKEDLAARDTELQDLRGRIAELEQLQKTQQSLIEMKDSDLAAAQKRLAEAPGVVQDTGTPAWLWVGLALLVLAGVAWVLSRRRKPSPLPPLSRHGFDRAELAASMPAAAVTVLEDEPLQASQEPEQTQEDESDSEELPQWAQSPRARDAVVAAAGVAPERREPVLLFDASRSLPNQDPAAIEPVHVDWSQVDLSQADLEQANVEQANVEQADLERTDPQHSDPQAPVVGAEPEVYVTDASGQWRDVVPPVRAAVHPGPAARERLELAIAYMDLGDTETARTLLNEVTAGNDPQAGREAQELLERLR